MADGLPDLARIGRPQQVNIGVSVLLANRPDGMPEQFVSAADLVAAIAERLRPIIREECEYAIAAKLALSEG